MKAYYVREVRNTSENSGDDLDFEFLGSSFSENGSTRGVLIDDAAAIYSRSSVREQSMVQPGNNL